MDTFSHALWGYGLFGQRKWPWLALLFGALPDLCSFGAFMLQKLLLGTFVGGKPALSELPAWLFTSYSLWHSFVICVPMIALVALWRKDVAFVMLGWPFHILLDFPFHSFAYFPTPIFWPISDFMIDGIPWSRPAIWLPNVAGIIVLLTWRYKQKKRNKIT